MIKKDITASGRQFVIAEKMSDYSDIDLFFMREGRTIQEYGMFSGSVLEAKTIGKENNSKNSAV